LNSYSKKLRRVLGREVFWHVETKESTANIRTSWEGEKRGGFSNRGEKSKIVSVIKKVPPRRTQGSFMGNGSGKKALFEAAKTDG